MMDACAEGRAGQGGRRCTRGNIFWSPLYPLGVHKLGGSKLVLHFTTRVFLFTTYTSYRYKKTEVEHRFASESNQLRFTPPGTYQPTCYDNKPTANPGAPG